MKRSGDRGDTVAGSGLGGVEFLRIHPPRIAWEPRGSPVGYLGTTWRRACATAGVPKVRLHDLRHVAQVFAAEAGATRPELMARLGHATPAAALVYLHARTERDAKLVAALGAAMAIETDLAASTVSPQCNS